MADETLHDLRQQAHEAGIEGNSKMDSSSCARLCGESTRATIRPRSSTRPRTDPTKEGRGPHPSLGPHGCR